MGVVVESTIMILGFLFHSHLELFISDGSMSTLLYDYGTQNGDGIAVTDAWDYIQTQVS